MAPGPSPLSLSDGADLDSKAIVGQRRSHPRQDTSRSTRRTRPGSAPSHSSTTASSDHLHRRSSVFLRPTTCATTRPQTTSSLNVSAIESWGQPTAASPQALSLTDTEPTATLNRVFTLTFQLRKGEKAKSHVATVPQNPRRVAWEMPLSPRKIGTSVGGHHRPDTYTTAPSQCVHGCKRHGPQTRR